MREWCGCGTLTDALLKGWLQRKGTRMVDHAAVLATAAEVASALTCLHEAGVIHGNLTSDRYVRALIFNRCFRFAAALGVSGEWSCNRANAKLSVHR